MVGGELVDGAEDGSGAAVEDVGVDHRGIEVCVAEEFLDGADVGAGFQEMGGEGVAEGVAGGGLEDFGAGDGVADKALEDGFVEVVASALTGARIGVGARGGEDPLPAPLAACVEVLAVEGVG